MTKRSFTGRSRSAPPTRCVRSPIAPLRSRTVPAFGVSMRSGARGPRSATDWPNRAMTRPPGADLPGRAPQRYGAAIRRVAVGPRRGGDLTVARVVRRIVAQEEAASGLREGGEHQDAAGRVVAHGGWARARQRG